LKNWPPSGPRLAWQIKGTGDGYSSFAVAGGRLYTLGARQNTEYVFAFDAATGKKVWEVANGKRFNNDQGDGPRGTPTIDGDRVYVFGSSGDIPVPADYDGDNKIDRAVFRPSTSLWYIEKSSGGVDIIPWGVSTDRPVPADYDGDGKADLAIFRPSSGQWWINRSSGAGVVVLTFGVGTDRLVPGDYTGDHKADIAIWRPSTGEWYVLRSEDYSYYSVPFGSAGDLPVPGDYDGDDKFDTAVFRPSTATWYANRSTAGILIQNFGLSTDQPLPYAFVP